MVVGPGRVLVVVVDVVEVVEVAVVDEPTAVVVVVEEVVVEEVEGSVVVGNPVIRNGGGSRVIATMAIAGAAKRFGAVLSVRAQAPTAEEDHWPGLLIHHESGSPPPSFL